MKKIFLILFIYTILSAYSLANASNTLDVSKNKIQETSNIAMEKDYKEYKEKVKALNLSYTEKTLSLLTYEDKVKNQRASFTYNLTRQGLSMINKTNISDIEIIKSNLEISKKITDNLKAFYNELYNLQPPKDLKMQHTELLNGLSASIGFYIDINTILTLAVNSNDTNSNINYLMKNFNTTVKNTDLYQSGYSAIEESNVIELYKEKIKKIDIYLADALNLFVASIQSIDTNNPKVMNNNVEVLRKITVALKISFDDLADITPPEELKSSHQKLKTGVFVCLDLFIEVTNLMDLASKANDSNRIDVGQRFQRLQNDLKSIESTLDLYHIGYQEIMATSQPAEPTILAIATDSKVENPVIETKIESLITDIKTENPVVETKIESPITDVKTENPVIESKIESPITDVKIESPVVETKKESPITDIKTENSDIETNFEDFDTFIENSGLVVVPVLLTEPRNKDNTSEKIVSDSDSYYYPAKSIDVFTYEGKYLFPSDKEYIKYADLNSYSRAEVALIRNEIFARHGYKFTNEKYRNYFNSKNWYSPSGFNANSLNNIERINIKTLLRYEKNKGWR